MKIVVTRPLAQAETLAQALTEQGFDAERFPLLEIEPADDPQALIDNLAQLNQFDVVVFVSPNALLHGLAAGVRAQAGLTAWPAHLPVAVMGPGSVQAIKNLTDTEPLFWANPEILVPESRYDSEMLHQVLSHRFGALQDKRVLIVRGSHGREWLADTLKAEGANVTLVQSYRRFAPKLTTLRYAQLQRLLQGGQAGKVIWTMTSSESIQHLVDLLRQICWLEPALDLPSIQASMQLYMPHQRIVEVAQAAGFMHCTLTAPGDAGLLLALTATLGSGTHLQANV